MQASNEREPPGSGTGGDADRIATELLADQPSHDPFASAVRATRMPMVVTNPRLPDNPIVFVNDSFSRLTGYAREEIVGRNCRFLQGPETTPEQVAAIRGAIQQERAIEIDIRNHRRNGTPFWNRLLLAPVHDDAGRLTYFFASQLDVTLERERLASLEAENAQLTSERIITERHLALNEVALQLAIDAAEMGTWDLDLTTDVLTWLPRTKAMFGVYTNAHVDMDLFYAGLHPDDRAATTAAFATALDSRVRATYDVEYRTIGIEDGVVRWVAAKGRGIFDDTGRCVRAIGTAIDITKHKLNELELRLSEQRLRDLNATLEERVAERAGELEAAQEALRQSQKMEAVGQLTGGIAHDFNNLLAGITGNLELLGTRVSQGRIDAIPRYLDAAQSAAKRATALTQRLLAFSRRQTLDPKPTAVNRLVAQMEDLLRRSIGPNVTMEIVGAAALWPTLIDPSQLENALLNLCINARDAMPDGGMLTIETANKWLDEKGAKERELAPGQYISLCVSDTGTGMSPDVVARAFDPFFTTKPLGQGTGLGLSMIYGFVRQSGGQVRIYSEEGQGTTMCLYLPRFVGDVDAGADTEGSTTAFAGGHGETVLVVDDESTVRMLIVDVLQEAGYRVLEAADGPEGLRILQGSDRIDLLVTDVGLPGGMNGRQVADAGRHMRPNLKVLFITGYAENAVVANGHLDPGMRIITKPFAIEALGNKVRAMIDE